MPELPEVETMRRGIAGIAGCTIAAAVRLPCQKRPVLIQPRPASLHQRIAGRRIEEVGRLGKRVVLRLSSGDRLIFEPRMTGLVLRADPPTQEHLRFRLDMADGPIPHVWYWDRRGLGSVRLLSERQLGEQLGGRKLGPDALALSADELHDRLGSAVERSRSRSWTSGPWPESATFTLRRFFIVRAFTPLSDATC
jgi:formamidopyrimidine-DNA glycosylase